MARGKIEQVDVEVGRRIKVQRLSRRVSQTTLAKRLGLSFQQIQKYEKGANRVGAGRLSKIAEVLGVPVDSFFEGYSQPNANIASASPLKLLTIPGALPLLLAYADIEDRTLRRSVVEMVQQIARARR